MKVYIEWTFPKNMQIEGILRGLLEGKATLHTRTYDVIEQ
jgi:hypothetical protein